MKLSGKLIQEAESNAPAPLSELRERRRTQTPKDIESADRLRGRLRFARAAGESAREAEGQFERIINGNDLTSINYLQRGMLVARSVGRVHVCDSSGTVVGFGTGFLIAPGVLMTNHHVLRNAGAAVRSLIEFDYELDAAGNDRQSYTFELRPQTLFFADEALDFAVVAVAPAARERSRPLAEFGWLKLIAESGKALLAEYLTIIQHPGGQRKQVCVRENQLLRLDTNTLWYATDTLGGSSGSPVFSSSWQVVALHHLGVPKKDAEGNWLTVDGQIWNSSMDDSQVQWIANEGIRVSKIVEKLTQEKAGEPLLRTVFDDTRPPSPTETGSGSAHLINDSRPSEFPPMNAPTSSTTFTVPLQITISVGGVAGPGVEPGVVAPASMGGPIPLAVRTPAAGEPGATPATATTTVAVTEAISIDPDYANRQGFDPHFLGAGALATPLPVLSAKQKADAAKLLKPGAGDPYELKYHHYSVVMNGRRKIAFVAAVNIDGSVWRSLKRETDRWILDPRIPANAQAGEAIYADNPLDRGHLVRRLDPAWGKSLAVAKVANDDTFHFTNCSPQHKDYNQGKSLWAGLEDYVLYNADKENLRVNVFSGPVFAVSDPPYRGIQLPKQFWKVVVAVKAGKLRATAYLLSQAALIADLHEAVFSYGAYKTFQVPVKKIEQLTGLSFPGLNAVDSLGNAVEGTAPLEVQDYENIQL